MNLLAPALLLLLAACDNFTPTPKVATVDPYTGALVLPAPCPDWSQTQTMNYLNEVHSNFGCATHTNTALQLADPRDLYRGHGTGPDTQANARAIELLRTQGVQPLRATQEVGTAQQ